MNNETRRSGWSTWLLLAIAAALAGCASKPAIPDDFLVIEEDATENTPLGGEALSQRAREMRRAHSDMIHFHATLETLHQRKDKSGLVLFSKFLDGYMGTHLNPLIRGEWQSRHPELMGLDANLRFMKADVLIRMRDTRRVQKVVEDIERRFQGRESMLVDYPIGEQSTLGEGLEILRSRKWRG